MPSWPCGFASGTAASRLSGVIPFLNCGTNGLARLVRPTQLKAPSARPPGAREAEGRDREWRSIAARGRLAQAPVQTLGLCSQRVATSARFFKRAARSSAGEITKPHRTFEADNRHIGIGDFSAQYLNGRRQATIFRLCGVALFSADKLAVHLSSTRTNPPGTGRWARPSRCRWLHREVFQQLL